MRRGPKALVGLLAGVVASSLVGGQTLAAQPVGDAPPDDIDAADDLAGATPEAEAGEDIDDAVDDAVDDASAKTATEATEDGTPSTSSTDTAPAGSEALQRSGRSAFSVPVADRNNPYGPRPEGVPALTLQQLIRFSLQNPLVEKAQQEVEVMEAKLRKVRFAWVPIVETKATLAPGADTDCDDIRLDDGSPQGFDFQWCRSGVDPDLDLNTVQGYFRQLKDAGVRFRFDIDMIIPITTFGKGLHLKRAAQAGVALRKLEKIAVKQETVMRVRQAYETLLLARESIAILQEAKRVVDRAKERVGEDLGGGEDDWAADPGDVELDRDPDDLFRVQLAELEVEKLMREALKVESLALSALWALAGDAAPRGFDVRSERLAPNEIDGGLDDLSAYKQMAIRERPEARMAAAAVRAREAQERLARAMFLPDLGIVLGFDYGVSTSADPAMSQLYYQDGFNFTRLTAALALRWKWDFHNKAFDLQAARATRRSAEYQQEAARLLLGRDVEEAYGDLVEARHAIDTNRRAVDLAWKLVVSQEQKDSVGGGDASKLLRALETWYRRRFDHVEAIGTYNQAVARLSRAVGTPLGTAQ